MRNIRSPLLAVILLFGVLLLIAAPLLIRRSILPAPVVDDSRLVEYRNPTLGFSLLRPEVWEVFEDNAAVTGGTQPENMHTVAFVPGASPKTFAIAFVQNLTTTESLQNYATRQMSYLQPQTGQTDQIQFAALKPIKLNGLDALATEAVLAEDNGEARQARLIMTVDGLRGYALLYIGPVGGTPPQRFQSMIDSFAFVR